MIYGYPNIKEADYNIPIFGLDRIEGLQVLNNKPFLNKTEEANEKLYNTIGLNFSDHEPCRLLLRFHSSQKPYLESLKLHRTQEEVEGGLDEFYTIKLFVSYNFELKQQLLKYGSLFAVLEPAFVREDIKKELEKALKAYGL